MIDLGFGEQNIELMTFLLAFFGRFAAGLISSFMLLRFEANFLFTPFGFYLQEIGEAAVKGAVIGGLVAQEERELVVLVFGGEIRFSQGDVLEALRALAEPVVLRHLFDQNRFGEGGGLMLGAKAADEVIEFILIFRGQDGEGAGEAVAEIVHRGSGFAFRGFWSCAVLSVLLVGGYLRWGRHMNGSLW